MLAPQRRRALTTAALLAAACGGPAPAPSAPSPGAARPAPAPPGPPLASARRPGPALRRPEGERSVTPAAPCPADMVLVEGGWCPNPTRTCLRGWHDPTLRRTVCLEYSASSCAGQRVPVRTCVARLEHPGSPGAFPTVAPSVVAAQLVCAEQGRRLCTEPEWVLACEGAGGDPFPTGRTRQPRRCGLDRARRAPTQPWPDLAPHPVDGLPDCGPGTGVTAQAANLPEWVAAIDPGQPDDDRLDGLALGGTWLLGERNECRSRVPREPEPAPGAPAVGVRCCAEPAGAPTDPLLPRQRARGWSRARIERIGRGEGLVGGSSTAPPDD